MIKQLKPVWMVILIASFQLLSAQNNNGLLDDFKELFQIETIDMPTPDGATLATDVFLPITSDSLVINVNIPLLGNVNLELIPKGMQYIIYPEVNGQVNPNPFELPIILTRSPYSREDIEVLGYVFSLLGYAVVFQDARGVFGSTDLFIPLYTDSWDKTPYSDYIPYSLLPEGYTQGGSRNPSSYSDGSYLMDFVLNDLKRPYDIDEDGVVDFEGPVGNGSILFFGASALSNSGFQMALSQKTNPAEPGLKGFLNVISSSEYWSHNLFNNGVFKEGLVSSWVDTQLGDFNENDEVNDNSIFNSLHTPGDYDMNSLDELLEAYLDLVSIESIGGKAAVYPNGEFRMAYDATRAPVDEDGFGDPNGAYSRYMNLDMPFYNISGWWDIFASGQIETWRLTRQHISEEGGNRSKQKLVIGPWQHYYPSLQRAGDLQFPENVGDVLGFTAEFNGELDLNLILSILNVDIKSLLNTEVFSFIRYGANYNSYKNIGEPTIRFPANLRFQEAAGFLVQMPSEDLNMSHADLLNWLLGLEELAGFSGKIYEVVDGDTVLVNEFNIDVPPLPPLITGIFGEVDEPITSFPVQIDFEVLPDVRMYICGNVGAGVPSANKVGNYWMEADTFPIVDGLQWNNLYLHPDGKLEPTVPLLAEVEDENKVAYVHDPNDPIPTAAGNNLSIKAPDGNDAMGPRNIGHPNLIDLVMNRDDVLIFETDPMEDSLTLIGYPVVTLYASSLPEGGSAGDPTDTDLMIRLVDHYPGGAEYQITEGVVNARAREYVRTVAEGQEDDDVPFSNIESGKIYEYKIPLLPMGYAFGKNHRLKILISSSNYPRYQSNPNIPIEDNEFFRWKPGDQSTYHFDGTDYQARSATNAIFFTPEYPSKITLPVFGRQVAPCGVIADHFVSEITDSTALLNWIEASGSDNFVIRYRIVGTADWIELSPLQNNNLLLEPLASGSTYQWQVGSVCSDTILYSESSTFESTGVPTITIDDLQRTFRIYPNPVSDLINIEIKTDHTSAWKGSVRLLETDGKVVSQWDDLEIEHMLQLDVGGVVHGAYLLEFIDNDGASSAWPLIFLNDQ